MKRIYFQRDFCPYCGGIGLDNKNLCISCGAPQTGNITYVNASDETLYSLVTVSTCATTSEFPIDCARVYGRYV